MDSPIKDAIKNEEEAVKTEAETTCSIEVRENAAVYSSGIIPEKLLTYPVLEIDYDQPDTILYKGEKTRVNKKQFQLMNVLVKSPNCCVTKSVILNQVWGYLSCISTEQIKYHKCQLLARIKKDHPADPDVSLLIITIPKQGLRMNLKKEDIKINGMCLAEFKNTDMSQFNRRQMQACKKMRCDKTKLTTLEYCQMFAITKRTALRDLKHLLKRKFIIRQGRGKAVCYFYKGMSRIVVPQDTCQIEPVELKDFAQNNDTTQ